MALGSKSTQLQIRVSPAQKAAIERAARRAGLDMSAYVLCTLLPAASAEFCVRVAACRDPAGSRFALAELNEFLTRMPPGELVQAVAARPDVELTEFLSNYVAAMVEMACARAGVAPPVWTRSIKPLATPFFGSTLKSLRMHLLTHSPVPFRRRNIFIDSSIGSQR
jgi:hypothetical protein